MISLMIMYCIQDTNKSLQFYISKNIEYKIDSLITHLKKLSSTKDTSNIQNIFKASRNHYKNIEPIVEYYFQGFARRINGPALPDIKTDDNFVCDPSGFQVLEEIIFQDSINIMELIKDSKVLITDLLFIKRMIKDLPIQDHHLCEILQHQIIRIATLGITGFDSPIALNSLTEARNSLTGIMEYYQLFCEKKKIKFNSNFSELIYKATTYLEYYNDFNTFNRLEYIKEYLMPISESLEQDFREIIQKNPNFNLNKVFYGSLSDLMKGRKFNPDAYAGIAESETSISKIELGKKLFNSTLLSKENNMSCATCHNPNKAFTDGKVRSITNIHSKAIRRNAPTLAYSSLQKAFFYDMRAQDLENQIESVIKNPDEFNISNKEIYSKINKDTHLIHLFKYSFPNKKEITLYEIKNAIASYVRSLSAFNSKIDRYFKNDITLSVDEVNGFNLFTGKAKCATCHFIPLYNGTIPPWYNNSESEVLGVPENAVWKNAKIDQDLGRFYIHQIDELKYSFKTPTIRNISHSSPYMHNGIYKTLEDVIKFYNLGGGNGIGIHLEHQTLPTDKLNLDQIEEQQIIQFLNTLTDENSY